MSRQVRIVGTLVLTALAVAYLAWKIELGTTLEVLRETVLAWFVAAVAIMVFTIPALAARWGWLLRAQHRGGPRVAHARVPGRLHRRPDPADLARR